MEKPSNIANSISIKTHLKNQEMLEPTTKNAPINHSPLPLNNANNSSQLHSVLIHMTARVINNAPTNRFSQPPINNNHSLQTYNGLDSNKTITITKSGNPNKRTSLQKTILLNIPDVLNSIYISTTLKNSRPDDLKILRNQPSKSQSSRNCRILLTCVSVMAV